MLLFVRSSVRCVFRLCSASSLIVLLSFVSSHPFPFWRIACKINRSIISKLASVHLLARIPSDPPYLKVYKYFTAARGQIGGLKVKSPKSKLCQEAGSSCCFVLLSNKIMLTCRTLLSKRNREVLMPFMQF